VGRLAHLWPDLQGARFFGSGSARRMIPALAEQRDDDFGSNTHAHAHEEHAKPRGLARVIIEPISRGDQGQCYRVFHNGKVLVANTRNPEYDACRQLLAQGITGLLEVWHRGASVPALRLDIEAGARWTVLESSGEGPRLVRWRPHPGAIDRDPVSSRARASETGKSLSFVPQHLGIELPAYAAPRANLRLLEQPE
jgi:hypothetical protein